MAAIVTEKDRIAELRQEIAMVNLRESSFYQLIREEGELAAARRMILSIGRRKFGAIPPEIETTLGNITEQAKLEELADRLIDVSSWKDLLAGA